MNRAIAWFAENRVAANLVMVLLLFGGLAALPSVQQKAFPDVDINVVQIGVAYLGAAPEEVEEGVCVRIEEEIQSVEGIERITSSAAEGSCGVSAEIVEGYPTDRALAEIKNGVDSIDTFPEEAEKPVVKLVTIRRESIQVALSGPVSETALKVWGERLRDEVQSLPEVTQAELTNVRRYEISVEVPESSLRRHGLTFEQVVAAVRRGSLDRPGGSIKTAGGEVLLRTKGQAYRGAEFERLVVLTRDDGTRLLLGDVANVVDGFEDEELYARFDGERAVMLRVFRVGEQRLLTQVAEVKEWVAGASARLPDSMHLTVWRDGGARLRSRLDTMLRNGRSGFILVFVVLALFLRLRVAFWVALGVPLSILGALALFPSQALSIDLMTLFSFILVLGLLVDDAIVVGENVHRHQERAEQPLQASITGTQEVSVPVIFGVLTTIAAFSPMFFAPGGPGQVFGAIALVVTFCLVASVVESQLVLPAHLGHMRIGGRARASRPEGRGRIAARWESFQSATSGSLQRLATEGYRPALERALEHRYTTLACGVAALLLAAALPAAGYLKFTFFPPIEGDYVTARLSMPLGTPVEVTERGVLELEAAALRMRSQLDRVYSVDGESVVRHILVSVGEQPTTGGNAAAPAQAQGAINRGSHVGEVSIELVAGDLRPVRAREVEERWRAQVPPISDVEELVFASDLFSAGDPINLQLQSSDVDALQRAASVTKERLAQYDGVFDISDSFKGGKDEIKLTILPAAETLGLTLDDLGDQVRQAFYGEEAQRIQRGRDDIRVMVRYPKSGRRSLADLANLRIRTADGGEVPFYRVAKAERGVGYSTIHRADRQRVINVTANIDPGRANAGEVLASLRGEFIPELVAQNPGMSVAFEGAQRQQGRTLSSLARNYSLALLVIYGLLAVPLRSYTQPLIIMAVIPFGLVGAVVGHLIMGLGVSMMSIFGVVALSGVVVNSSLVLVHYINSRRAAGDPLEVAVRDAGVARFRPVVLTALTTFAGLAPLLTERSISAQFMLPMASSLAFGVIIATAISLFLVPSAYLILEDLGHLIRRDRATSDREEPVLRPVRSLGSDG